MKKFLCIILLMFLIVQPVSAVQLAYREGEPGYGIYLSQNSPVKIENAAVVYHLQEDYFAESILKSSYDITASSTGRLEIAQPVLSSLDEFPEKNAHMSIDGKPAAFKVQIGESVQPRRMRESDPIIRSYAETPDRYHELIQKDTIEKAKEDQQYVAPETEGILYTVQIKENRKGNVLVEMKPAENTRILGLNSNGFERSEKLRMIYHCDGASDNQYYFYSLGTEPEGLSVLFQSQDGNDPEPIGFTVQSEKSELLSILHSNFSAPSGIVQEEYDAYLMRYIDRVFSDGQTVSSLDDVKSDSYTERIFYLTAEIDVAPAQTVRIETSHKVNGEWDIRNDANRFGRYTFLPATEGVRPDSFTISVTPSEKTKELKGITGALEKGADGTYKKQLNSRTNEFVFISQYSSNSTSGNFSILFILAGTAVCIGVVIVFASVVRKKKRP